MLKFKDLSNATDLVFVDISSEEYRCYTFSGGGVVKIDSPIALSVSASGHRVLDGGGISHYIPNGWIHLEWKGSPHFVC